MGDDRTIRQSGERAIGRTGDTATGRPGHRTRTAIVDAWKVEGRDLPLAGASDRPFAPSPCRPLCLRCGFEVSDLAYGCKNPCPNCGTVYPLGDCSD